MCIMQRVIFGMIGVIAFTAALHNPVYLGQKVYALLLGLTAIGGASVAIRQLWLQSLPEDQVPGCPLGELFCTL